nr:VWA domain-containing protein [Planctomycetota bacterium]
MPRKLLISAVGVSLTVHVLILAAFALIRYGLIDKEAILLETVFSEERQQEEFSQELDLNTEISENLNPVAGGVVTGAIGAATGPTVSQTRIETSESLKEPVLVANIREFSLPGESLLGEDLGESAVMGETGAAVEGYGAALSRLTRELLRMMRESKVMVVWLFDESESMKDDQKEIRDQFHKVYEELGIAAKKDETLANRRGRGDRPQDEILLTSIVGFGEKLHPLLETPSADLTKIREAIDKIAIDESGLENMSRAVRDVVAKYRVMAGRQDRRLVLVIVSDESGDDGQYIEEAINEVKRANAPVYILGREAVFGYPYA